MDSEIAYRQRKQKKPSPSGTFLSRVFIHEKLNSIPGYFIVTAIALLFGYLVATKFALGLTLFGAVLGLFVFLVCLASIEAGLYLNILYSFFAFHLSRLLFNDSFPVGVVTDILIMSTFLGIIVSGKSLKKAINQFAKIPLVAVILLLVFYLLIELFNPYGHSFDGWFQSFRRYLGSVLLLFVSFNVFDSMERVKRFIVVLFILCTITAIYGCIQQWHGLFDFELAWVRSDDNRAGLYFIMGSFRKFSTMSDPTAFGVAMAASAIFFLIYAWHLKNVYHKIMYFTGVLFMILAMGYSGTRTANIMMAAGIFIYILLSLNKPATRKFAAFAVVIFLLLLYGPYANPSIIRFRTSFMGSKDESYKVREVNRAFIQPYIYSHPIGGGLGTTGASGLRFNRGHYLSGFPPDSGYLRKALETGWIGLAIIMILYFMVLRFGVRKYFVSDNDEVKIIYAACIGGIFSFYMAEFAQEAIGQITDIVIYYPMIAIMLKMPYFKGFRQEDDLSAHADEATPVIT